MKRIILMALLVFIVGCNTNTLKSHEDPFQKGLGLLIDYPGHFFLLFYFSYCPILFVGQMVYVDETIEIAKLI